MEGRVRSERSGKKGAGGLRFGRCGSLWVGGLVMMLWSLGSGGFLSGPGDFGC